MKNKLSPTFWLVISIVYMVSTFILSSLSFSSTLMYKYKEIRPDLILHFVEYAILAILLLKYLAAAGWLARTKWSWWVPIIIGGVVGGANELLQVYVPNRFPSVSDVLANIIGAAIPVLWMRFINYPATLESEDSTN